LHSLALKYILLLLAFGNLDDGTGGDERTSHDALLPTILSKFFRHVTCHFDMDAVRLMSRCERPFDLSKLIYVHCIDLGTKKFTTVTSFPCVEISCVLGHLSFPRELAVRRLCCVLWSDDCKGKLSTARSPVLINVKSSCYFTVTIIILLRLYLICVEVAVFLVCSRRGYGKPSKLSLHSLLLSPG